jgi:hypothetical protein
MTIKHAVERYLAVAGQYGQLMPLSAFDLQPRELKEMIATWEDDYQLSRHYELVPASYRDSDTQRYSIEGVEYSGIIFHPSVAEILGAE